MSDTLIEKVARALAIEAGEDPDAKFSDGQRYWTVFQSPARVAIDIIAPALQRLQERVRELEDALRPFADFAEIIAKERPGWDHDQFTLINWQHPQGDLPDLMLTPFRRARSLVHQSFRLQEERRSFPRLYFGCVRPVEPTESPFHDLYNRSAGIEGALIWLAQQYADAAAGHRIDVWARAAHSMIDLVQSGAERYYAVTVPIPHDVTKDLGKKD